MSVGQNWYDWIIPQNLTQEIFNHYNFRPAKSYENKECLTINNDS